MYNWYSALRPLNSSEDIFCATLVVKSSNTNKTEPIKIENCEFTIENIHYPLLVILNGQVILPVEKISIITQGETRTEVCSRDNEGLTLRWVEYLRQLGTGEITKIKLLLEHGLEIELTKKDEFKLEN